MSNIKLDLTVAETDFIASLLAQVPTGTTMQAGMLGLLGKIGQQAQESSQRAQQEALLAAAGAEQALS